MAQAADQVMCSFLARLSPEVAASFTSEQLAAISLHFGMRYRSRHAIDVRGHLRLPPLRLYFIFLVGKARQYS